MCAVRMEVQACVFAVSIGAGEFLNCGVYATTWICRGQIVEFAHSFGKRRDAEFRFLANGKVRQLCIESLRTALRFRVAFVNLYSQRLNGSPTRTGSGRFPSFQGYAKDRPDAI